MDQIEPIVENHFNTTNCIKTINNAARPVSLTRRNQYLRKLNNLKMRCVHMDSCVELEEPLSLTDLKIMSCLCDRKERISHNEPEHTSTQREDPTGGQLVLVAD